MIKGIKIILSLFWQDIINLIHIAPSKKGGENIVSISKELQKNGIIKIPNFLSEKLCNEIKQQIESLANEHSTSIDLENGTRVNYRSQGIPDGPDAGMLDIIYVENAIPEVSKIDQKSILQMVENVTGQEVFPLRAHAYYNVGVKNTRSFHIDNTQPVIYKAFIYLSDVSDLSYGPYAFVKGTHRLSIYPYINLIKNLFSSKYLQTDMPYHNSSNVINATGSKGDLILSNQNGIHRGQPQMDGKKRVALVLSFMVKSKLSFLHQSAKDNIARSKNRMAEPAMA